MDAVKVKSVDEYIALQPSEIQIRLEELRWLIKNTVPDAEETISYNMPAYKFHGMLVGFAGWKKHCGFYPWNGHTVSEFAAELKGYKTSAGAIQLPNDEPLPKTLLQKIIKKRINENVNKEKAKK